MKIKCNSRLEKPKAKGVPCLGRAFLAFFYCTLRMKEKMRVVETGIDNLGKMYKVGGYLL